MAGKFLVSRIALAVALSSGLAGLALPVAAFAKDKAAGISFSPGFAKAAADLDKAVAEAKANPAITAAGEHVRAAKTPAEKQAAAAEVDAALGGGRAKLAAAGAAATTPGDKLKLGELTRNMGVLYGDPVMQHQGLVGMIDSGALQPAQLGQVQFFAGVTAYQTGNYAGAIQYLKPASDSGYRDPDGLLPRILADSYKRTGNTAAVMDMSRQELAAAQASGAKPSETAIRTALQAAYEAKNTASAVDLSTQLVRNYPTPSSWSAATTIVRALTSLPAQDNLDLMRLMARTNALQDRRDYLEYLENADPRRNPGESLKIIDAGVAAGKLTPGDVGEARQVANARLSADRASLPALERDASSSGASAATITGAADAFLSYGEAAKAEALYRSALAKPGVDKDRVLTRLGIAQSDVGQYAQAQQSFAQVGGVRAPVAKLWSAYAANKAGGGAATPQ
jgi:hypothetical protein